MVQQLAQPLLPPGDGPRMTFEEFQRWYDAGHRGEWVEGEVIEFMPPSARHQLVLFFLTAILDAFARSRKLGTVIPAAFEMRIRDGVSYREPDILFIATEHADRLSADRLIGPADLAVEIVSPSSALQDRRNKFVEYAVAGVTEYWIVDPRPGQEPFEAYRLTGDERYVRIAPEENGRVPSIVLPGLRIDPQWFSEDELPNWLDVLRDLGLI